MRKIYTFLLISFSIITTAQAQNILFEDFQSDSIDYIISGFFEDPQDYNQWLNVDVDGLTDVNDRPLDWFRGQYLIDTTNVCIASSSWLSGSTLLSENWLILPRIWVSSNSRLIWKSAPRQGPRYLDGYKVLISTGTNSDVDFTDTLAVFAENTGWVDEWDTTTYTYSSGIIHPDWQLDSVDMDTTRLIGVLHEWDYDLSAYADQPIYIAFFHGSYDDNLIYIDDVTVTGNTGLSVEEVNKDLALSIYPNPASESIQLDYYVHKTNPVIFDIYNQEGQLVDRFVRGIHIKGNHHFNYDVNKLSAGNYFINLTVAGEVTTQKFVVVK